MVTGVRVSKQMSSRVLDLLEFINNFGQCTMKIAIAVVQSGSNERMYQSFGTEKESDGLRYSLSPSLPSFSAFLSI